MAVLTAQAKSNTSPLITFAAASALGDECVYARNQKLLVRNDSAVDMDITITSEAAVNEVSGTGPLDWVETVTAGKTAILDLTSTNFRDVDGNVNWSYESATDIFVALITL